MRMRTLVVPSLTVSLITIAAAAWAGPPLLCFPYEVGNRPVITAEECRGKDGAPRAGVVEQIVSLLDQEPETLVRMETIRRAAIGLNDDRMLCKQVLAALSNRIASKAAPASKVFDFAFACETFGQATGDGPKTTEALASAARDLGSDPAGWLALACANTPLMRRGTLEAHAAAFVKAWDGTHALGEGPVRDRLVKTLERQLDTLESYIVKEGPSREDRLAELRRLAAKE